MLTANELRIGNLVQHEPYPDEIWTVDLKLLESIDLQLVECVGVLIMPEILLKCGFTHLDFNILYPIESRSPNINYNFSEPYYRKCVEIDVELEVSFNEDESFLVFIHNSANETYFSANIKSVHQLQNLYFALTGTELNVSPLIY